MNVKALSRVLLASALLAGGALQAAAQTSESAWWLSGNGIFETPSNWDTRSVPGVGMTAVFAPEREIIVTLSADVILGGLDNQGTAKGGDIANLILELGGHSLVIGGEGGESGSTPISLGAHFESGSRRITFRHGRIVCPDVVLNNPVSPESSCMVVGEGAELDAPVNVGNNEKGELHVESGGRWISRASEIYIGRVGLSAEGVVKITGKGSNWKALGKGEDAHSLVGVGASGTGLLEISRGGKMTAFVVQLAGYQAHLETPPGEGRGRMVVKDSGSEMECAFLYVGGGRDRVLAADAAVGGAGTVEVVHGGRAKCGLLRVFPHSTLTFRGGSLEQTGVETEQSVLDPSSVLHFVLEKAGGAAPFSVKNLKIDGALLDIELAEGFSPRPGQDFPLVSASGALEVNFKGIKNGEKIQSGGHTFVIDFGPKGTGPIRLKVVQAK